MAHSVRRAEATRRWRTKLRESGRSWLCVISVHESCSGRVGRLIKTRYGDTRPLCTCPCHSQPEEW